MGPAKRGDRLVTGSEPLCSVYESDDFLLEAVSEFIGPALRAGDAGIVVATPEHWGASKMGCPERDSTSPRLGPRVHVTLDAAETLARFMVDAPDSTSSGA